MATRTFYFSAYDAGEAWPGEPALMVDGNATSWSYNDNAPATQHLTANSYPGDGVGDITAVEIRVAAGTNFSGKIHLRPIFAGYDGPDLADFAPLALFNEWSPWYDITAVTNAPEPWAWADVAALDCDVVTTSSGGFGWVSCSQIEIRVTYEAPSERSAKSAGRATLRIGMSMMGAGASTSDGAARAIAYGPNTAVVTQAGALVDALTTAPVKTTQAGGLVDALRVPPLDVTQAGALLDADQLAPVRVTQAGALIDVSQTVPVRLTQVGVLLDARFERPETTYNCWEMHVYDRVGHYLAYLDNAFQTAYLEQINECGGGSFVLPAHDAKATPLNLAIGNVVRPRYRNVEIGAWTIDEVEEVLIADGEGAAQLLRISGRGLIGSLDKGIVYPSVTLDPTTAERSFTAQAGAAIWLTLWNEFLDRGGGELNMGFTAAVDSAGLPWPDALSLKFRAGQTLLDVLRQLSAYSMDVVVDPDRTMLAYQTLGRDLSDRVAFRAGLNIMSSTKKTLGGDLANAVLGAGQDVLAESTDAASIAAYGRRETYLSVQNTTSGAMVDDANELLLDEYAAPRSAITLEVAPLDVFPFFNYDVGDTVHVDIVGQDGTAEIAADYRILSISVREASGPCDLRVSLELNSLEAEYLIKLQKALRASLLGIPPSSGSAASLASSTTSTTVTSDGTGLGPEAVKPGNIDWGTGTNQVYAASVPLADVGGYYTTDNVEAALQEAAAAIETLQDGAWRVSDVQAITAGAGITEAMLYPTIRVQGDGGAVTVTATPSVAAGTEGQVIRITGESDTETVTLQDAGNLVGSGLHLPGGTDVTLGLYDVLTLVFVGGAWRG